jgi:hypothetical protein
LSSNISLVGLTLSVAGAAVDFVAGTAILQSSMDGSSGMVGDPIDTGSIVWAFLLFGLAALLVVTGVMGVMRLAEGRMMVFGLLMMGYGGIMLVLGSAMFIGATPMMQGVFVSTLAMFVIGLGMILNGMAMMFTGRGMPDRVMNRG